MTHVRCPFCNSIQGDEYIIQLHIEEFHTEDSPFVPQRGEASTSAHGTHASLSSQSMPDDLWTKCTRRGCGEYIQLSAIDEHLDFHAAADLSEMDNGELAPPLPPRRSVSPSASPPPPLRTSIGRELSEQCKARLEKQRSKIKERGKESSLAHRSSISQAKDERRSTASSLLSYFSGTSTALTRSNLRALQAPQNPGRLGKRELGPHAYEKSMPSGVRKALIYGAEAQFTQRIGSDGKLYTHRSVPNETCGLPRAIADLCALEANTAATYLCHPSTKHVYKIECDGNFCGFWSSQVVLTYIQHVDREGPQSMPHVIEMQSIIEDAWKNGICAYDKVQTGGILNTRKWIGTTEALAFFTQIGVKVDALTFKDGEDEHEKSGVEALLDYIEAFYMSGMDTAEKVGTSHITHLPPIYFQRFGHSMTIIGIERLQDGCRNLLVFDSSFATSTPMLRLTEGRRARALVGDLLTPYRRSDQALSKWDEFEILM